MKQHWNRFKNQVNIWKFQLSSWWRKRKDKKQPSQNHHDALDQYADDQIKDLLVAVRAYRMAKRNPVAFVEQYFSAKIAPRLSPDTWAYDIRTGKRDWLIDFSVRREEEEATDARS